MWRRRVLHVVLGLVLGAMPVAAEAQAGNFGVQPRTFSNGARIPLEVTDARVDRLEQWLYAVDRHVPGEEDASLGEIQAVANTDLRFLWIETNVLAVMLRNPRALQSSVRAEGQTRPTTIAYTPLQRRRLMLYACAAAGILDSSPVCADAAASHQIGTALRALTDHAAASRKAGDRNYILRRGALLHTDLALLQPPGSGTSAATAPSPAPNNFTLDVSDGRDLAFRQSGIHWSIARTLLDNVTGADSDKVAPATDPMVRSWYRATASWMQYRESYDYVHLNRARQIFPNDPDILFLSGSEREVFATAAIQSAIRSAHLPPGVFTDIHGSQDELRQAEAYYRRTLELRPDAVEARLRHGRVLDELGRHPDAVAELQQVARTAPSSPVRVLRRSVPRRCAGSTRPARCRSRVL